ncbi:TIM barrel protein [Salibaculum sp.]|uniref:TIM barrel protein n=1 Tax=Salibaculum sp. TaxID=2855480 RepID=UPI002B4A94FD|nr:TIM barrel protein [Salibaculum sp.]HKL70248.1 TIM barrel protein [Salibaculum sp.]
MQLRTALNHMTVPGMGYAAFLDLASRLGCVGVEVRNDIPGPLFDGAPAIEGGQMARDRGLRLLGLGQVQPFNDWTPDREREVAALIATAREAGAETISLIPRNDGTGTGNGERHANLRIALKAIRPMLDDAGLVALVEPLGFIRSSLRSKQELVETIEALDAADRFRLVHDTFHHTLVGGGALFAEMTGIVHVSGVSDTQVAVTRMEDAHRGLVDAADRLGNVDQVAALIAQGYDGPVSMECFAPEVHALADPEAALRGAFDFMSSQLAERAA